MAWGIYLLNVVDGIDQLLFSLNVLFGLGIVFYLAGLIASIFATPEKSYSDWTEESLEKFKLVSNKFKICIPIFIIFLFLNIFIPSSKTIAAMYIVPKIINNQQVEQLPSKALEVMNKKLDAWLDDLIKKENKE